MPDLNWDAFVGLPGAEQKNFELLCRGVVRHNFGSYGVPRALANQPGVEFHLRLDRECGALGAPGRWWGWQCKWWDLPADGPLGSARRTSVVDAIRKTETHVPGVTDWVLWTRRPLRSADQTWFRKLSSQMMLHLWTEDDLDTLLVGQAAVLRSTYFGELILTPEMLRDRHDQAIAPIRARWRPEVHRVLDAELELRRMLGESDSWDELHALSADLLSTVQLVEGAPAVPASLAPLVAEVIEASRQSCAALDRVADWIRVGDLDLLCRELSSQSRVLAPDVATAPRRLRSGNHRAGLYVTNAVAGCRDTLRLVAGVESAFSSRVVAVLAPAGCGKTQLAAQLTAATSERPHGVLLHGRDQHANHTLDDLARRVVLATQPVPSMEALLAAVDAAGERARHRLPVVIDGLNESEDPRAWKPMLAELYAMLAKFPYVLLVCTLRPEFQDEALAEGTLCLEIDGYGDETVGAIREHFRYWKIVATDVPIPVELLQHPLTLRLFCEVTNPTRHKDVGIDAMPGSLTAMFDLYLKQVGDRIAELAPRAHRYYPHDVHGALRIVGDSLWESRSRFIDRNELRSALGDAERPWDQSLLRALEHEGVLLRMPSEGSGAYIPAYDLLGGHIIASALLARHGQDGFETWIRETSTTKLLAGAYIERHPLAEDICYSIAAQIPRRFYGKQLWKMVGGSLRSDALQNASGLEPRDLDRETVDALLNLARQGDARLLDRLREVRGKVGHPLNAEAVDRLLRTMEVADRDLHWTEWLRRDRDCVITDLDRLEKRWRAFESRPGDRLRARWIMWTLTSTVRCLRDQATRALYWFGRADPAGLFDLIPDALAVNDAYVSERVLAAAYGVVISHQRGEAEFEIPLAQLLGRLSASLVGESATAPTHHYLSRLYVRGIVAFAARFYPCSLPEQFRGPWAFANTAAMLRLANNDPRAEEVRRTVNMDFENYTIGSLFEDRRNYDMEHPAHQAAVSHVLGAVWSLGWRTSTFEALDRGIAESAWSVRTVGQHGTERYGKKYGWIGFYEHAGVLEESRLLRDQGRRRLSDLGIDPSFPEAPPSDQGPSVRDDWIVPGVTSQEQWMCETTMRVPATLLVRDNIGGKSGPWVAIQGSLNCKDNILGRRVWASVSALVVSEENVQVLVEALVAGETPGWSVHVPSDHYTFAGEIPWHPDFAAEYYSEVDPERVYLERVRVDARHVDIESLAHEYAWESYHSELNFGHGALIPSRRFSDRFGLYSAPQSFDQFLSDGTRATATLEGVGGLDGVVLYVRADIRRQYVDGRGVVWITNGERRLWPYSSPPPDWLEDVLQMDGNVWQDIYTAADLDLWGELGR